MAAKPIKSLELHYTMIQFLIITFTPVVYTKPPKDNYYAIQFLCVNPDILKNEIFLSPK